MKKIIALFAVVMIATITALATGPFRNHRWESFRSLMPNGESIVFVGNSITNMHDWWEAFGDNQNILNRGTSGGFTYEVLPNLESIIAGHPAKVFIGIGTNDICEVQSLETTADNIRIIAERILRESPNTKVYVQSTLPSTSNAASSVDVKGRGVRNPALNALVEAKINALRETYSNVEYVNVFGELVDTDGKSLKKHNGNSIAFDNLHPNVLGYGLWCQYIQGKVGTNCIYDTETTTLYAGGHGSDSTGDRITCFAQQNVTAEDVLIIGDEMVSSGEWHELLKSPHAKNRGLGWGYTGSELNQEITNAPIYFKNKTADPKAIVIYAGVQEARSSLSTADFQTRYQTLITALREQVASKIYLLTPLHTPNAAENTRIDDYNATALPALVSANANVHIIDATELNGNTSKYYYSGDGGNYLTSFGYVKVAQKIAAAITDAGFTAITDQECETNNTLIANRTVLGNAITDAMRLTAPANIGSGVGQYTASNLEGINAAIDEACIMLRTNDNTAEQLQAKANALKAITPTLNAITSEIVAGKVFQIYTPNRDNSCIVGTGAGNLVICEADAANRQYADSRWRISAAGNNTFNIQNGDGEYLDPSSLNSGDLRTTATAPATGWIFSPANTPGTYVIKTTDGKYLNVRGEGKGVCNYPSGGITDAGNQFTFSDVTAITEVPTPVINQPTGTKYTIRATFKNSSATRYLVVNSNGALAAVETKPVDDNGLWYISDNTIQSAVNGYKYLGVNGGFYLKRYPVTVSITQGTTSDTKCVAESGRCGAIGNDGAVSGGQYSNNTKHNTGADKWSTDLVFEEFGEVLPEFPVNGKVYTIYNDHVGTPYYVSSSQSKVNGYQDITSTRATDGTQEWIVWGDNANGYKLYNLADNSKIFAANSGNTFDFADVHKLTGITLNFHSTNQKQAGSSNTLTLKGGKFSSDGASNVHNESGYEWSTDFVFIPTGQYAYKVVAANGGSVTVSGKAYTNGQFCVSDKTLTDADLELPSGITATISNYMITLSGTSIDDTTTILVDKNNGKLYKDGSTENETWNNIWKSTNNELTFSTSKNNMQWNNNLNIDARTGGNSATVDYTLTAASNKRITGYTVTLKALDTDQTWVINGNTYTITQTPQTITVKDLEDASVIFKNTGNNVGTVLSNFSVTLIDYDPIAAIMSTSFSNAKWLQIANSNNQSYAMATKSGDVAGNNLHTVLCNAADNGQFFAFVGDNTNGFAIYNKALGETYTLKATGTGDGTAATWEQNAATPQKWFLDGTYVNAQKAPGYVITTNTSSNMGLNMYAGAGGDAKFYNAGDNGTHWQITAISSTPTIIRYVVNGEKTHQDANRFVGYLNISKGTYSSNTYITPDYNNTTSNLYLPKGGQTVNVTNTPIHGWTCNITENNGNYTVTYTAEQTDYQYLAFDKSAQWYRIPAIVTAQNGDLVAIYDYRVCHGDVGSGEVDQRMRRSTNNGATWTTEETIADGSAHGETGNVFGRAFGDPALVADRESGKMTLICVSGQQLYPKATATSHPKVAGVYSTDNGVTWGDPVDLTDQFFGAEGSLLADAGTADASTTFAYAGFFGSGKILQSRKTKINDTYRLYAAMLCQGKNVQGAYVVYSDDFGHTWSLLGGNKTIQALPGSDEPKVEELPNGSIVLSGRKYNGRYFNIWKWTTEPTKENPAGAGSWDRQVDSNNPGDCTNGIKVGGNSCNGEILLVDVIKKSTGQPAKLMLQSLPAGNDRSNVEIWYKDVTDATSYSSSSVFGSNWTKGLQVSTTSSAYSTMTVQKDGKIGFFYEEGPATYCMVYVPLTIAQITKDAYHGNETPIDPTTIDVTYNIYLGDKKIGEKKVTETVGQAPTANFIPEYYVNATGFPQTIAAGTTSYNIQTSYKNTLPFETASKYYNIKITVGGSGTFWWYNDNGNAKELNNAAPTSGNENKAMWLIGGDWYNGFTIQSREDGKYIASPAVNSHNVQANLVSELCNLAKFELVHKSGGGFCFKVKDGSTYLAHTSINSLNLSMWNVEGYNGNLVTFAEAAEAIIDVAALQAKIEAVIASEKIGTVGYPDYYCDEIAEMMAYSRDYGDGVTESTYEAAQAAYHAVLETNDIVLPEDGKAYYFVSVQQKSNTEKVMEGNEKILKFNTAEHTLTTEAYTSDMNITDEYYFICHDMGDGKYIFVNNYGYYLRNYATDNAGALSNSYREANDYIHIVKHGVSDNGNTQPGIDSFFGLVALKGYRAENNTDASIVVNGNTGGFDKCGNDFLVRYNAGNNQYSTAFRIEEVAYPYNQPKLVKADNGYYASIYLPFAMQVPEGIECYRGTADRGGSLSLEQMNDNNAPVPAGGYILYSAQTYLDNDSESPTYGEELENIQKLVTPAAATPEVDGTNLFTGSTAEGDAGVLWAAELEGNNPYVLANKSKGIGFYRYTGNTYPKGKAIWMAPVEQSSDVVRLGFDDILTAIEALHGNTTNAEIFDLQGRRLDKVEKGKINVINGQKIMFK